MQPRHHNKDERDVQNQDIEIVQAWSMVNVANPNLPFHAKIFFCLNPKHNINTWYYFSLLKPTSKDSIKKANMQGWGKQWNPFLIYWVLNSSKIMRRQILKKSFLKHIWTDLS